MTPPPRVAAPAVLVVVAALLVVATAVDVVAGSVTPAEPAPASIGPAASGAWYCPVTAAEGEDAVVVVAAVGDRPSQVRLDRYADGAASPGKVTTVAPDTAVEIPLRGGAARQPTVVNWSDGPATALWRVNGSRETAAACEASTAERWHVTGFDTTLGSRSVLHVFNPYTVDAVFRIVFTTPSGPVRLVLSDNLLVEAGRTRRVSLNRFQPEVPDLGAIVDVLTGRLVVQGEVDIKPPGDSAGTTGRALLPAAPEPSSFWGFAGARHGDDAESWLSVLNPGQREAAVEVRVSDPLGRGSRLLGEVSVPAGGVTRVELAKASRTGEFGVSVAAVNDQPVVVTRLTSFSGDDQPSVAASLGAPQPATEWALPGGGTKGRSGIVSVYNPGAKEASVDFLADGAPRAWSNVVVPPNGRVAVSLERAGGPGRRTVPVTVLADEPVVAELRSLANNGAAWTAVGVPGTRWSGPRSRSPLRLDPELSTLPSPELAASEDTAPVVGTEAPVMPPEPPGSRDGNGSRRQRKGRDG